MEVSVTTAARHSEFSALRWCLALSLMGSWSWLFYLLYVALR